MDTRRDAPYTHPNFSDIPSINLYMDQLLEFLNRVLAPMVKPGEKAAFTKTMINNYVKQGLIQSPTKKKYPRETICDLIILYHLKSVFSITESHAFLNTIRKAFPGDYYQRFTTSADLEISQLDDGTGLDAHTGTMDAEYALERAVEIIIKKRHLLHHFDDTSPHGETEV